MGKLGQLGKQMMTEAKAITQNAKTVRQGQILPSDNTAWGFYGTISHALQDAKGTEAVWNTIFAMLMSEYPDASSQAIREFLDSKYGRHFADSVVDELIGDLGKRYNPDSDVPIPTPAPARMKAILKKAFDSSKKWVAKELTGDVAGMPTGTAQNVATTLQRVEAAWAEAQAQEKKKNWKERDAAMHTLQAEADRLATAARAWLAQRR